MDLSIKLENTTLYIRVAALIKTEKGYLFEKSSKGYIYTVGGKLKLNESSLDAVKREVKEELGIKVENITLRSVLENFYTNNGESVHEICFIYEVDEVMNFEVPPNFIEVLPENADNYDIRPKPISDLIKSKNKTFQNIIVK
jgi:8-oxo-dGTP pyrophosphatase MutT (NUDIX family)